MKLHLQPIDPLRLVALHRGNLLGKIGGKPGVNGAEDFTTGEYLHWEVFYRENYLDGADFFLAENDFE
jgi:hypothetical protein